MTVSSGLTGELRYVKISNLRLDPFNPRLPPSYQGGSQTSLAEVLEIGFQAFAVAESIADSGFFHEEPLLVIAAEEAGTFVVVEGNRRLTALLGLTNPDIRKRFSGPEKWDQIAQRSGITVDTEIPVVVHSDRDSTHRQVARAHVIGKLGWQPLPQALYIAARVAEGRSFEEVADLLGLKKSKVADMFRDQAVLKQMREAGLDTGQIEGAFSLLTVAMSSTKIRDFVGAPLGSQLAPGNEPIPAEKTEALKEAIQWIFGSDEEGPKIRDSREISRLGNVIASEVGLASLRAGDSLEASWEKVKAAGMDPLERLMHRLVAARSALLAASDDLGDFADDPSVVALVDDLEVVLEGLRNLGTR